MIWKGDHSAQGFFRKKRVLDALVLASVAGAILGTSAFAAVDVQAVSIGFRVSGQGALSVVPTFGVWHDDGQTAYTIHITLVQKRDNQVLAVLLDDAQPGLVSTSSSCERGCKVQSCTGTCYVDTTQGECAVFVENCDGLDGYRECKCTVPKTPITIIDLRVGDVFELAIDPGGATDLNPSNNVLRVAYN